MVKLRFQSIICWNYIKKSQITSPDVTEIANESVYGMHKRMLSEMDGGNGCII